MIPAGLVTAIKQQNKRTAEFRQGHVPPAPAPGPKRTKPRPRPLDPHLEKAGRRLKGWTAKAVATVLRRRGAA